MAFFQEPMLMAQKSPQTTCWIIQEKALPKKQLLREVLGLKNDVSFQRQRWKSQIQTAEPAFSLAKVDKHPTKNNFSSHPSTNAREKTGQPLKKGPPRCPNNNPKTRGKKTPAPASLPQNRGKCWDVSRYKSTYGTPISGGILMDTRGCFTPISGALTLQLVRADFVGSCQSFCRWKYWQGKVQGNGIIP